MSARSPLILAMPCDPCTMEGIPQPNRTSEHHQNLGGHAGQKRLGDAYSVPLCLWHHQAEAPDGYTKAQAFAKWGPSLATHPRLFRALYGSDTEMRERTNRKLPVSA